MTSPSALIPIAVGAVIVVTAFAEVPREKRRAEWPILGAAAVAVIAVGCALVRRGAFTGPQGGQFVTAGGANVIPFRLPHAA